jgi:hypothetical protein
MASLSDMAVALMRLLYARFPIKPPFGPFLMLTGTAEAPSGGPEAAWPKLGLIAAHRATRSGRIYTVQRADARPPCSSERRSRHAARPPSSAFALLCPATTASRSRGSTVQGALQLRNSGRWGNGTDQGRIRRGDTKG